MKQRDDTGMAGPSSRGQDHPPDPLAPVPSATAGLYPFGPHAPAILATEHWSLLSTRSLIWGEALNRTTVFLTVLSGAIVALALLADATGFGPPTTQVALVLLSVVMLLGIATFGRLVRINTEEHQLVLAMNRLRLAYLKIEPGLEPYFSTGHHDDEQGLMATYMLDHPSRLEWWMYFLVNTPTIVATVVATLAGVIVSLVLPLFGAASAAAVAGGVVTLVTVWGGLFLLQQRSIYPISRGTPKFPTPT